jgi:hypothetical protein
MALFPNTLRDDDQAGQSRVPTTPKKEDAMAQAHVPSLDSVICHEVTGLVSCTFDELVQRLPAYSWAQVFAAVDRLSRKGTLTISRTRCFGYIVSIGPSPPTPQASQDRKSQALFGRLS